MEGKTIGTVADLNIRDTLAFGEAPSSTNNTSASTDVAQSEKNSVTKSEPAAQQ